MAKKSNKGLSALSMILSGASMTVDVYNAYVYRSKHKKLSYASIVIGLADVVLDTYLSLGSKNKFVKAWSLFSLTRQVTSSIKKIKAIQSR
ncbi:hypothetical protein DOS70_10155 [Staphylococcus felis]|uniref:hypothetical protein n=1 Tax=Staphylococcus felis TaxID=46127 RepID=UPI000CD29F01|nr:hypothetical protein [Staphylococcus felis]AVP35868.1 hypothetical protein C7J90_02450 [Staphylococcus felis]MDQ7193446.1 hypothetical protein [Staphylococcus felis]PNZ36187.1 hypothetical protein CD143_04715 [Staphylococcus felis]QQB04154.1 hypothetical protein I6H71_04205 [Staphylococcus felis]REH93790.1 hypothetical protein DOS70_10155 [Staphylococcus felis]